MTEPFNTALSVEKMSLSNVAEGEGEELFQEELVNALAIFADSEKYVHDKDGNLVVTVNVKVDLIVNTKAGTSLVGVSSSLTRPKKVSRIRAAYLRSGTAYVDKMRQEPLPLDNVRPITGKKEE